MKNDRLSLKYRVLRRLVKAANIKKRWTGMRTEELLENRRKQNAKNKIPDLSDDAFTIDRIEVMGCPVLRMIHKQKTDKANLFLIGGGMISAPRPGSVKKALRFAKETGLDVFVPYYPLCTEYPLTRAYEMIHKTYRVMLRDYAPENISVLGTSSGGNLALGMIPYINDGHADTPAPHYIMAISPGTCVHTDEEWQRMQELDEKDVAIPAQYMKTAEEIMRHGDNVPDYMLWLQNGDFCGCPKVTFVYGGWDGIKNGFSFWQFFVRFLVMLYLWKAFDIVCLDWLLLTKSHFFQHFYPETEGCAGYHSFGFNRKEQIVRIVVFPFVAAALAGICLLIG